MRILRLTSVYPAFAREFAESLPRGLTSSEIQQRLVDSFFGFTRLPGHFTAHGHEAADVYTTVAPLQKAWANENGIPYDESTWRDDLTLARVQAFRPDVLYLNDVLAFGHLMRRRLREAAPRALLVGWCGILPDNFTDPLDLDLILTLMPHLADRWRACGLPAEVVPLAFEPAVLDVVKPRDPRDLDVTFTGTIGRPLGAHARRFRLVVPLLEATALHVWTDPQGAPSRSLKDRTLETIARWANRSFGDLSVETRMRTPIMRRGTIPFLLQRYPDRFHPPVFGTRNFEILARSRIAFNNHLDIAEQSAGNLRLFEATGMGACLLTDWKRNLKDLFEPDSEVVTYRDADECIAKVRWLLDHEAERRDIAEAGQRRTLRDHTVARHAARLAEVFRARLASRGTPA